MFLSATSTASPSRCLARHGTLGCLGASVGKAGVALSNFGLRDDPLDKGLVNVGNYGKPAKPGSPARLRGSTRNVGVARGSGDLWVHEPGDPKKVVGFPRSSHEFGRLVRVYWWKLGQFHHWMGHFAGMAAGFP